MNLRNVADPSFKKGSRIFKQRAPNVTCSELTAPRGEYAALRRAKSAFVFAVKSQSSPQLIESVLSLILGLEPENGKSCAIRRNFLFAPLFPLLSRTKRNSARVRADSFPVAQNPPNFPPASLFDVGVCLSSQDTSRVQYRRLGRATQAGLASPASRKVWISDFGQLLLSKKLSRVPKYQSVFPLPQFLREEATL